MKRSSIVAASAMAALLVAAPAAGAAAKPADAQYRGTVKNGGKFVVDVDNGRVTTVQAYFPVNCTQESDAGGELLIDGVNLKLTRTGNRYAFRANSGPNPRAVVRGTWNASGNRVTGTIVIAPASLQAQCADAGGPGQNGPISFSATRQPS
jgi:hypothetical protein